MREDPIVLPQGIYTVQRGTKSTEDEIVIDLVTKKSADALGYKFLREAERLEGWSE
jgi:hypothetical protein